MRHPVAKALALVLAAIFLAAGFLAFGGVTYLINAGLYQQNPDDLISSAYAYRAEALASNLVNRYAAQVYSNVPDNIQVNVLGPYDDENISWRVDLNPDSWYYTLRAVDGQELESTAPKDLSSLYTYEHRISGRYFTQTQTAVGADRTYSVGDDVWYLVYTESPVYQVTVYLQPDAVNAVYGLNASSMWYVYNHRYTVMALLCVCILGFVGCIVSLCVTAGQRRKADPIRPGGLNRLPLDLYLLAVGFVDVLLVQISMDANPMMDMFYYSDFDASSEWFFLRCLFSGGVMFLAVLAAAAFIFALAAQCKAPGMFWWKNSVVCRILKLIGFVLRKLWSGFMRMVRHILELYRLLPVMWQWLITGFGMGVVLLLCILMQSEFLLAVGLLICAVIVVYGAWAFGKLRRGAQQMAQGSLRAKVSTKYMTGAFKNLAEDLNELSDVTLEAADVRLRSERMKAELITNVSHDIKTPLTSIINYVDLLPKAEDETQKQEYLQILNQQSLRLKRLIEDLTEMSRASTGNIQTNIAPMDAVEGITQALGEFSDKLSLAGLQVCTQLPEEQVMIEADGRLFWRVMSNLLSNVVKYAMPGTRVYVQLTKLQDMAQISVKNISREPLSKDARELTERFVRGDASRNTEGSGLGLSIAGSLMDVQKGSMQIQVDADLFTAVLTFPAVQE